MTGQAACRVGDQGVWTSKCTLHDEPQEFTTTFTSGSAIADILGVPICINDLTIGLATCGHHTLAKSGSGDSGTSEGTVHRVGDVGIILEGGSGTYVATSGSPIVDSL